MHLEIMKCILFTLHLTVALPILTDQNDDKLNMTRFISKLKADREVSRPRQGNKTNMGDGAESDSNFPKLLILERVPKMKGNVSDVDQDNATPPAMLVLLFKPRTSDNRTHETNMDSSTTCSALSELTNATGLPRNGTCENNKDMSTTCCTITGNGTCENNKDMSTTCCTITGNGTCENNKDMSTTCCTVSEHVTNVTGVLRNQTCDNKMDSSTTSCTVTEQATFARVIRKSHTHEKNVDSSTTCCTVTEQFTFGREIIITESHTHEKSADSSATCCTATQKVFKARVIPLNKTKEHQDDSKLPVLLVFTKDPKTSEDLSDPQKFDSSLFGSSEEGKELQDLNVPSDSYEKEERMWKEVLNLPRYVVLHDVMDPETKEIHLPPLLSIEAQMERQIGLGIPGYHRSIKFGDKYLPNIRKR